MKKGIYWHDTEQPRTMPKLEEDTRADYAIIGGGMAGLSAAQWLREEADADVIVIDKDHCGAGASGHNSGNLMPDALTDMNYLLRRFGEEKAGMLAHAAIEAVHRVIDTSERYTIDCERMDNDTLFVASNAATATDVKKEHAARRQLGLSSTYLEKNALRELLGTNHYQVGIGYDGTLGMNSYKYILGLRDALVQRGLRVYEDTPALGFEPGQVITPDGTIKARHVIVCIDRFAPSLGIEREDVYHQQHHLAVSEPLKEGLVQQLFPRGRFMVHGFAPHFVYYRLTPDNRLVVGGMLMRQAYRDHAHDLDDEIESLLRIVRRQHPALTGIGFSHGWAGLYGITRDMLPIAGKISGERHGKAGDTHAAISAGSMAWSQLAGRTAAQVAHEGNAPLARFLAPHRTFTPLDRLTSRLDKSISFPLSHAYSANLLRGTPEQVAKHEKWLKAGLWSLALGGALYAANRWLKSRRYD